MKIHVGFDLTYESAHSTPMIFMLNVHPSRAHDLITPDRLRITPSRAISPYIDGRDGWVFWPLETVKSGDIG